MSPADEVAIHVMRWAPFVPFVAWAVFRKRGRGSGLGFALTALGFLASVVGDTLASLGGGTWFFVPYYMIVQLGLFAAALLTPEAQALLLCILVHAGIGTVLYFFVDAHRPAIPGQPTPAEYAAFMRYWYPYQSVRLLSFGLFVRAAWRA